ncbi:MAG: NAD-dependent epimerase/dehydratase family protein [Myxococcales bacterium]|nr:NAD-dependent epimerase/dehydratase family protein [Myxococcales bacterium]
MDTVLVAGAGGFIGSHIVEQLSRAGHRVAAMDRPGADLSIARGLGAEEVHADLADQPAMARALEGASAAVNATGLFDLAATKEALDAVNVRGALAFAQAARSAGVKRLVHLSSVGVYGRPSQSPMPEDGPLRPRNPYEVSKLEGEQQAMELHGKGLEVAVLRPTLVYGPRSRYGHAMLLGLVGQVRALSWRRFPTLFGGPLGHYVHAADVARAAALCAVHPGASGQAFNVADDAPIGLGDTFRVIVEAMGLVPSLRLRSSWAWAIALWAMRHLPDALLRAFNRRLARGHAYLVARGHRTALAPRLDRDWISYFQGDHVFDTTRLRSIGFRPEHPDFRTAVHGVIGWYAEAGWLPPPPREAEARHAAQGEATR